MTPAIYGEKHCRFYYAIWAEMCKSRRFPEKCGKSWKYAFSAAKSGLLIDEYSKNAKGRVRIEKIKFFLIFRTFTFLHGKTFQKALLFTCLRFFAQFHERSTFSRKIIFRVLRPRKHIFCLGESTFCDMAKYRRQTLIKPAAYGVFWDPFRKNHPGTYPKALGSPLLPDVILQF